MSAGLSPSQLFQAHLGCRGRCWPREGLSPVADVAVGAAIPAGSGKLPEASSGSFGMVWGGRDPQGAEPNFYPLTVPPWASLRATGEVPVAHHPPGEEIFLISALNLPWHDSSHSFRPCRCSQGAEIGANPPGEVGAFQDPLIPPPLWLCRRGKTFPVLVPCPFPAARIWAVQGGTHPREELPRVLWSCGVAQHPQEGCWRVNGCGEHVAAPDGAELSTPGEQPRHVRLLSQSCSHLGCSCSSGTQGSRAGRSCWDDNWGNLLPFWYCCATWEIRPPPHAKAGVLLQIFHRREKV